MSMKRVLHFSQKKCKASKAMASLSLSCDDERYDVGQLTLYGLFGISHKPPHRKEKFYIFYFFHFPPITIRSFTAHYIGVH